MGWRENEGKRTVTKEDGKEVEEIIWSDYRWKTFGEAIDEAECLAHGLRGKNLHNEVEEDGKKYSFIALYAKNRPEWIITDLACMMSSVTTVTLYDTLGAESSEYILGQCEIQTIFTSGDLVPKVLKLKKEGLANTVVNIVSFDDVDSKILSEAAALKIQIIKLSELTQYGKDNKIHLPAPRPEDLYTILYTSGTTGNPKGVMLTHSNFVANCNSLGGEIGYGDVHISYLPLAHSFERMTEVTMLAFGGSIGFYHGNVLEIKDDLLALKPTVFCSVPRLWNKMAIGIKAKIGELTGLKK